MTDRDLLEIIATQVNKITKDVDEIKVSMATKDELAEVEYNMSTKLAEVEANMATKQELEAVKSIVVRIENDHGQKLAALFNGYKQNSEKINRIEKEVSRHEEIIMRRIR